MTLVSVVAGVTLYAILIEATGEEWFNNVPEVHVPDVAAMDSFAITLPNAMRAFPAVMLLARVAVTVVADAVAAVTCAVMKESTPAGLPVVLEPMTSRIAHSHPLLEAQVMTMVSVTVEAGAQYQVAYDDGPTVEAFFCVNVAPPPVVATAVGLPATALVV
jgi:hypothetical protein